MGFVNPNTTALAMQPFAANAGSVTNTSRGWPFSSKNTSRLPSGCGSPTVWNLMISVLPFSMSTLISSPGAMP